MVVPEDGFHVLLGQSSCVKRVIGRITHYPVYLHRCTCIGRPIPGCVEVKNCAVI